jgi:hypothetical protein
MLAVLNQVSTLLRQVKPKPHALATNAQIGNVSNQVGALSLGEATNVKNKPVYNAGNGGNHMHSAHPTQHKLLVKTFSWNYIHGIYTGACFLAEGGCKKVYKVYNSATGNKEVISIMNTKDNYAIDIETEYEVSKLLTFLVESNACPNFLQVSDIFTCNSAYQSHTGAAPIVLNLTAQASNRASTSSVAISQTVQIPVSITTCKQSCVIGVMWRITSRSHPRR